MPEYTIIIIGNREPTDITTSYDRRKQIVEMREESESLEDFKKRAHALVDEAIFYMNTEPD